MKVEKVRATFRRDDHFWKKGKRPRAVLGGGPCGDSAPTRFCVSGWVRDGELIVGWPKEDYETHSFVVRVP